MGRIARTIDGGQHWTNVNSGMGERIQGIDFRTPQKGAFVSSSGGIFTTTNGALNVRKMHSNTSRALLAVNWMNDSTIIACGDSGTILRSSNSGWSWEEISTGTSEALLDMVAVDSLVAYSSGTNGMVIKTQDAGLTWTTVPVDTLLPLRGIHFLNRDTGMTVSDYAVFRTNNGGLSWELKNDSILSSSDFNDVWMTSKYVAYAAGTFGRMYKTVDGGEIWRRVFPSDNTNAEIDEMQFFTDSIGYFARLNSQSITLNGGTVVGSMSTYCLANNGGVDAIDLPTQEYGYCAGGISYVLHTMKPSTMLRTYLQDSIFCAGTKIFVGYNAAGLLYNNNVVNAELSNASGDFSNPTIIGTYTIQLPETDPSGIITCTLPAGINGDGYRIRVVCVSPAMSAPDNGYNLHIHTSILPQINLTVSPTAAICGNEPVTAQVSGSGLGVNPRFVWSINSGILSNESPTILIDTLSIASTLSISVTSSLTCANPSVNSLSTSIDISETPVAFAGNDTIICIGESVQLGAPTVDSFTWFPTENLSDSLSQQPFASPTSSTAYVLSVSNAAGCSSKDTVSIQVQPYPVPPVITLVGGELIVEGNLPGTYTWYLYSDVIPDETNDTLLITSTGEFSVMYTDPFGCSSTSEVFPIGTVGIELPLMANAFLTVNDNRCLIQRLMPLENYQLNLFDMSGRQMMNTSFVTNEAGTIALTIPALSSGIYFIQVMQQDGNRALFRIAHQ